MRWRSASVAGQRLQRRDGVRLSGRPFQDLGVAIDRRRDVVELLVKDPGQPQPDGVGLARVADAVQRRREVLGQLVPLPLGAEQAFQLRGRAAIRGIDVHRLAQRPDRAPAAVQLLLIQLRAPAQQRQLRRRIDRAPRLLVDQLAQLLPGAPALQRRLEQLRRIAIVRTRVEQAPVVLLGLGPLSQPVIEDLRGPADDVDDRRLLAQLALEVIRQQARQVVPSDPACRPAGRAAPG